MRRPGKPESAEDAKPPVTTGSRKNESSRVCEFEKRLAEAIEQQTATSEILRVISRSQTDAQPVFDAIAANAARLCGATDAIIRRVDGNALRLVAHHGLLPGVSADSVMPFDRASVMSRAVVDRQTVHIDDLAAQSHGEFPVGRDLAKRFGYRTVLATPLLRDGVPIGVIGIRRLEVRPFSDKQIKLLETFADQAVIAIENSRLFNETQSALASQTATADILRVISRSPTDVQPVFDAIVATAVRLLACDLAVMLTCDSEQFSPVAGATSDGRLDDLGPTAVCIDPAANFPSRAIRERAVVQIPDWSAVDLPEHERRIHERVIHRDLRINASLYVPILRAGDCIGVMALARTKVGVFGDAEVALAQSFVDQAVIAIENVRLFNETKEALDQQRASGEVLAAISGSIADTKPVFDKILTSCESLFLGNMVGINLVGDDGLVRLGAYRGPGREELEKILEAGTGTGSAIRDRRIMHFPDVEQNEGASEMTRRACRAIGARAVIFAPMLWEGKGIGVIFVGREYAGPFSEKEIALLKTFADQAVIAIQNARLFNETKEALEQQTATSEILRAISQSPMSVRPVFDTIVGATLRLCSARSANLFTFDGQMLHLAAHARPPGGQDDSVAVDSLAMHSNFPRPPGRDLAAPRAVLTRAVVSIPDVLADPEYTFKDAALAGGFRSVLAVPLIREGSPIGAIVVGRPEPGPFPETQIALLRTFADQGVIAIENVRLFTELGARTAQLTRSVGELKALGEVGQAVSSTLDLEAVLSTIVSRAAQLAGMDGGSIWEYDDAREEFSLRATDRLPDELVEALQARPVRKGEGALGRLAITGEPVGIRDIVDEGNYQSRAREILIRSGYRSVLVVPLLREDNLLGALAVNRNTPGDFAPEVIELLQTFATQSALAIQNARLYQEVEIKSRELETASRHKSEFLANMSHELRTPLNAIIGFSEVLSERMFGEINEKQSDYIGDILESGQHLLSLINDILDLSKIEAGRMELEATDFDLPSVIESTLVLVRERAHRRGITLAHTIDERLAMIRGDERKVKQVLLNLLSNALKFTPEGGQIGVQAELRDGAAEISVTDTGVGIAPEDQEAVFEEFRQVGTASKKVEGTGLGLAISRKFIELHGGRIWVESQFGKGSTFAFTLPLQ